MPTITLPDGNRIDFPKKVTGLEVAEKISKSLAKQAMIISVNGELKDLDFVIENNCSINLMYSIETSQFRNRVFTHFEPIP